MRFEAKILDIKTCKSVSFISFASQNLRLSCINLQNPKSLKIGSKVFLGFKSADVLLCKDLIPLLSSNKIKVRLLSKNSSQIITALGLQALECRNLYFEALIENDSAKKLALNDEIYAYISYTSLFIDEILC